jgi:hypothetical protein
MTLSQYLPEEWAALRSPLHAFMVPVLGTLTILLAGLLVSRFTTHVPASDHIANVAGEESS